MSPTPKQIGPEVKPEDCSPLNESMCRYVHELEREVRAQETKARDLQTRNNTQSETIRIQDQQIESLREQLRQRTAERDAMSATTSRADQADAWLAVCNALTEVVPNWYHGNECGQDKAVAAIKGFAGAAKVSDTLRVICKMMHLDLKEGDDMTVALPPAIEKMLERDQKLSKLGCQMAEMRHRLSYEPTYPGDLRPQIKQLAQEFAQLCLAVPVQAAKPAIITSRGEVCVEVPAGAKQVWARRLAGGVLQVGFTFRGIEVADSEGGTPD